MFHIFPIIAFCLVFSALVVYTLWKRRKITFWELVGFVALASSVALFCNPSLDK